MTGQDAIAHLIQTKLHRPPLPVDLVLRPRLIEWLEQRRERPLTLVSAPAGYGKSTLISCWLRSADCPSAWLSLDEHDNALGGFLRYFLAAIQTIFPDALPETQALLQAPLLPQISTIAHLLINEIDQLGEPFLLVLDDFHVIEVQPIHDLLNELLLHPPRNLHLVLGTRMDPVLPLVSLRADGRMTEIRSQDLRFSPEETRLLFQKMIEVPVDRATVIELDARAEGWVTGLRLAALAMRHRIGWANFQEGPTVQNRYVTEYLFTEILARQASTLADCLVKTSILERFCAEICDAVCFQGTVPVRQGVDQGELNGHQFLAWLEASNLFAIPLDDRREWFRYHHVFRSFLRGELTSRLSGEEIAKLHATAGRWCAEKGWIEEALNHLLAAN
ncbi:MAG: transcriptional regulator, partial [Anaerolineae bacterium]